MRRAIFFCLILLLIWAGDAGAGPKRFVGSQACKACHEKEYDNFSKYAKKAHSFESIKKMERKLTPEELTGCFECHTTGYGQEGGFVSEDRTPELKDAGCEVCHGPGSLHVESQDPADIVTSMTMDSCRRCHNGDRVSEFKFTPMLFGGAH